MRILVVGGGGREHALAWRLRGGPDPRHDVLCAPGNAGIARDVACLPVEADDLDGQVALARSRDVDLVVVGPEASLVSGLADRLRGEGIPVLGPSAAAARLEGSKAFAKKVMTKAGVPTARYGVFESPEEARRFARELGGRVAVKADGLAAGKGVILASNPAEADAAIAELMERGRVGEAGKKVVVEERLSGEEASFIALCDGERVLPLAGSQDHKPVFDGDRGPNTGGMGAVSPAPVLDEALCRRVTDEVMTPIVGAMREMGHPFRGVLYAGLMIDAKGPKVLEFNVRFGDPETQPLMMRLAEDPAPVFLAAAEGDLGGVELTWRRDAAVCVVMASEGYPGPYPKGVPIEGLDDVGEMTGVKVFHAGTARDADGRWVTAGGRVLGVTARGEHIAAARERAYEAVRRIRFAGAHYRTDIGRRAAERAATTERV